MHTLDVEDLEAAFNKARPYLEKGAAANGHGGVRFDAMFHRDMSRFGVSLGDVGRPGREFDRLNGLKLSATIVHQCDTCDLPKHAADDLREEGVHHGALFDTDLGVGISLTGFGPYGNVSWSTFIMDVLREIHAQRLARAA